MNDPDVEQIRREIARIDKVRETEKYAYSGLEEWFELDLWTPTEAACIICDIDPNKLDVDWAAKGEIDQYDPKIYNAQLFPEDSLFCDTPREQINQEIHDEVVWDLAMHGVEVKSGPVQESDLIRDKDQKLRVAEDKLRLFIRVFYASIDRPKGQAKPSEFVSWALSRSIEVPWLDWAIGKNLLPSSLKEKQAKSATKKTRRAKSEIRKEEMDDEVRQLRAASKKIAIKLKTDGIDPKRITAERVCKDLLHECFSNGKPFTSRWRTANGMRTYLKNEHHPCNSSKFREAKSSRSKFN